MDNFSNACNLFSLTITLEKTQVMGRATPIPPTSTIDGENLEVINQFQYLGSTTTDTLSLDTEINKCINFLQLWQNYQSQRAITNILLY